MEHPSSWNLAITIFHPSPIISTKKGVNFSSSLFSLSPSQIERCHSHQSSLSLLNLAQGPSSEEIHYQDWKIFLHWTISVNSASQIAGLLDPNQVSQYYFSIQPNFLFFFEGNHIKIWWISIRLTFYCLLFLLSHHLW